MTRDEKNRMHAFHDCEHKSIIFLKQNLKKKRVSICVDLLWLLTESQFHISDICREVF